MKKESRITAVLNSLLSAVLAMLGFSACEKKAELEYGTPHGEFQISGLVEDEESSPVEGARVISRQLKVTDNFKSDGYLQNTDSNEYFLWQGCDTVYSDKFGRYDLKVFTYLYDREVEIVVEDPSGMYGDTSRIVELDYKGGSGWNFGTAKATADFTLKKADKED